MLHSLLTTARESPEVILQPGQPLLRDDIRAGSRAGNNSSSDFLTWRADDFPAGFAYGSLEPVSMRLRG